MPDVAQEKLRSAPGTPPRPSRHMRFLHSLSPADNIALRKAAEFAGAYRFEDVAKEKDCTNILELLQKLQKYRVNQAIRSILWIPNVPTGTARIYGELSQGGSLFKYLKTPLGTEFVEPLTRQMWLLIIKNNNENFISAMRRAQCQVRGGSSRLVHAIQTSFLGREIFIATQRAEFWDTVIHWFCNHDGMWDKDTTHHVLDYIRFQHTENANFSMKGRTPEALMKATEQWQRQLQKMKVAKGSENYEILPIQPWESVKRMETGHPGVVNEEQWTIVQIKNSKDLLKEGRGLNHCVYSYHSQVVGGRTAIFSLRYKEIKFFVCTEEKPLITIELNRNMRSIVQARGTGNRAMTYKERELVREWADLNGFRITC